MQSFLEIGLPVGMFLLMFWLGLDLKAADFARVFRSPRLFLLGILLQAISLPAIALTIILVWPLPLSTGLAMGVMVLAASPGGITSNLFTRLAGGDTALSISLTATMTLASVVTLPVILALSQVVLGDATIGRASVASLSLGLFAMVAVPVGLGVLVRARFGRRMARAERVARAAALVLIASLLILALFEDVDALRRSMGEAALLALSLNLAAMGVAAFAASAAGAAPPQASALTLECGLQSTPLAITLIVLLDLPEQALSPAAVYGVFMLTSASFFALARGRTAAPMRHGTRGTPE
jgi:bile acid:Na+ symporter, BASS family